MPPRAKHTNNGRPNMALAITHADLLQLWPESQVRRAGRAELAELGLPRDAVRVLAEVGLPAHVEHYDFESVPPRLFTPPAGRSACCQIGKDYGGDFSVELATGEVWGYLGTGNPEIPPRFVNSTLDAFVASLVAAARNRRDHLGEDNDVYHEGLLTAIRTIDPHALDDDDNYWAVILEQMETGLF